MNAAIAISLALLHLFSFIAAGQTAHVYEAGTVDFGNAQELIQSKIESHGSHLFVLDGGSKVIHKLPRSMDIRQMKGLVHSRASHLPFHSNRLFSPLSLSSGKDGLMIGGSGEAYYVVNDGISAIDHTFSSKPIAQLSSSYAVLKTVNPLQVLRVASDPQGFQPFFHLQTEPFNSDMSNLAMMDVEGDTLCIATRVDEEAVVYTPEGGPVVIRVGMLAESTDDDLLSTGIRMIVSGMDVYKGSCWFLVFTEEGHLLRRWSGGKHLVDICSIPLPQKTIPADIAFFSNDEHFYIAVLHLTDRRLQMTVFHINI